MDLHLIVESVGGDEWEVGVAIDEGHTAADLAQALTGFLRLDGSSPGLLLLRRGERLDPEASIGHLELRHGDRLVVLDASAQDETGSRHGRSTGLANLAMVGGPETGRLVPLAAGSHTLGRSKGCSVVLTDLSVSRRHLRLEVTGRSVVVTDLGSSAGTYVAGELVAEPRALQPGDLIEVGHTVIRFEHVRKVGAQDRVAKAGVVAFNRPPRAASAPLGHSVHLAAPPSTLRQSRLSLMGMLAPLMMGVPLVLIGLLSEGQGRMVLFGVVSMALSPVIALLSHLDDRRTGRADRRQEVAAFRRRLAEAAAVIEQRVAAEVLERRRRAPDPYEIFDRLRKLRPSLWERRARDSDYLEVSLGWADLPARMVIEFAEGGDEDLRREAEDLVLEAPVVRLVPATVRLTDVLVLGLHGEGGAVASLARWIVIQLASLHSPRDVVIVGMLAVEDEVGWGWLRWLPHSDSEVSPVGGGQISFGDSAATGMLESLTGVVNLRVRMSQTSQGGPPPQPTVVALVSGRLGVPRATMTRLLEDGPAVGVYVLWLGDEATALPGECGGVVECASGPASFLLSLPGTGGRVGPGVPCLLSPEIARDAALSLAPIRDVTSAASGLIPQRVSLLDLLGLMPLSGEAIASTWRTAGGAIDAPVGVAARGAFVLDIRRDGPHALVGGTTGAGKSELLQAFIGALAGRHPPSRVTFLLVDYKGGAAFKDAARLPHTVGMVTDLDGHLVRRALVSLEAELRHREHVLREHAAKDLEEMERRVPGHAPPALILIVDEFAALAKELPEFVDGVVNVAQRGRSLGIHLLLATQRPAGAINDNIRANTNLRVALRMNDEADSLDVINAREAALLPRSLPGRAFFRTGQSELAEVQVAYPGAALAEADSGSVEVWFLGEGHASPSFTSTDHVDRPSELQALVMAIGEAAKIAKIPTPRPPWLPPLSELIPLQCLDCPTASVAAPQVVLGVIDLPEEQQQRQWSFDLEREGNLLVFGVSGGGKTTLLRTMAVSLAEGLTPSALHLYALDFGTRGLGGLEILPHVGSVIAGADIERVQRLIRKVEDEIARRRDLFESAGVSLLSEYARASSTEPLPRIVVLLDGYTGFTAAFEKIDYGDWIERVNRIVADGRPLGIHWVLTADRPNAVGMALLAAVPSRLVLRMANEDDFSALGLDSRLVKDAELPPGRGFLPPGIEVQVALVGKDPAGQAQMTEVERVGRGLSSIFPGAAVPSIGSFLPEYDRSMLPVGRPWQAVIGVSGATLQPVGVDLSAGHLLVAGPNRSGRSTALAAIALGLRDSTPDPQMFLLAPRQSPLVELGVWDVAASGFAECEALADELVTLFDHREEGRGACLVFIDDGEMFIDTPVDSALESLARRGRDLAVTVVGASEVGAARRAYGGWVSEARRERRAILLSPDNDLDGDLVGVQLPRVSGQRFAPGRGYLAEPGTLALIQIAHRPGSS